MIMTKTDFIKSFLPEKITDVSYAQVDMDVTDLSIADILRNANKTYPVNTRSRNSIASGQLAIGILCKTETLDPLLGLLLVITDDENVIEIVSRNYIVISIPESKISNDEEIAEVIEKITVYLLKSFKDSIQDFHGFYVKYLYDAYELREDDEHI